MPETEQIEQLTETTPLHEEANKGLMVSWINRDLCSRSSNDVRRSVILYDADKLFVAAMPAGSENRFTENYQAELYKAGIRYWSKGIV